MYRTPLICPECGELVIAWAIDDNTLAVPPHPAPAFPFDDCPALVDARPGHPNPRP